MKDNNLKKIVKVYGLIGKSLCGCAGGVIGFIVGGPFMTVPGVLAGILGGHYLEKGIVYPVL